MTEEIELEGRSIHKSVLLKEVLENLDAKSGETILDCTVNGGGHLSAIRDSLSGRGEFIGLDADTDALDRAEKIFKGSAKLINTNFNNLKSALEEENISKVDRVVFDLGFSSDQLEKSGRGFSFQRDEPLLMTLKKDITEKDLTAKDVVNSWSEESLTSIIKGFGEEPFAKRIAKAIVKEREEKRIETTLQLAGIIEKSVPKSRKGRKIHPATKTFQAIRIAVNGELQSLEEGLSQSWSILNKGGRIAVISFHSLEDRVVKHWMREIASKKEGKIISKKPIIASENELKENPRSRSAKLRIIEKI